jgi:predicted NBD/HSP70 family sugar kinase
MESSVVCVDVGYTYTRFGVWDGEKIHGYRRTATPGILHRPVPAEGDQGPEGPGGAASPLTVDLTAPHWQPATRRRVWLDSLKQEVNTVRAGWRGAALRGVGITFPGIVDSDGTIFRSNTIFGTTDDDLPVTRLQESLGLPVLVTNDMTAAISRYGEDPQYASHRYLMLLTISSGLGAKLYDIQDRKVVLSRNGRNGELALAVVDRSPDALTNDKGKMKGILGNYASGVGYTRMLQRRASQEPGRTMFEDSLLSRILANRGLTLANASRFQINSAAIEAIQQGDRFSLLVLNESAAILAAVLHTLIMFNAPDVIVLSGGFAGALKDVYRKTLVGNLQELFHFLYSAEEIDAMVRLGEFDDLDGLIGIGRIARRAFGGEG